MRTLMPILPNGYAVVVITAGEESPMEDHLGGQVAADDENKIFFVYESTVISNGTDSVFNACNAYTPKS